MELPSRVRSSLPPLTVKLQGAMGGESADPALPHSPLHSHSAN